MTEASFNLPEKGEARSASDGKVKTGLSSLKEVVNGKIDNENIKASAAIADTKLASPQNKVWHPLFTAVQVFGSELGAGTYILGANEGNPTASGGPVTGVGAVPPIFYFNAEDYEVAGKTLKVRVAASGAGNASMAETSFTLYFSTVTLSGTGGSTARTKGTTIATSALTVKSGTSATVPVLATPSAGEKQCAFFALIGTKLAAGAVCQVTAQLQARWE